MKRLAKEWKKDGFDDDFCGFIMGLDKNKEQVEKRRKKTRKTPLRPRTNRT